MKRRKEVKAMKITLAAARVNAGMTQEDAARSLNVSRRTISEWENGNTEPTVSQALILSDLYKIPLQNIFFTY